MQTVAVLRPHQLVWRDPSVWPFVWRGMLPLAALALTVTFALGPAAHSWIEGTVQRELRSQLDAAGFGWVKVAVSGQSVTLAGEQPTPGAGERALALAAAARCLTWSGRRTCAVSVTGRFSAPAPAISGAAAQLAAAACEQALTEALTGEQIQFTSASATIDAASAPLLDRLARQVGACPGVIRIEGHTDLVGRGAFNLSLSESRAMAVRDALIARGVPAERLQAQGFGARRPIADNHTASGRARNRRIELHAVTAN
jgi:outer membrane protein OmpA-like peptidoglycan-associated protein